MVGFYCCHKTEKKVWSVHVLEGDYSNVLWSEQVLKKKKTISIPI